MSNKSRNIELIRSLEPYMLTTQNINSLHSVTFFTQQDKKTIPKQHFIKNSNIENNNMEDNSECASSENRIFTPNQNDKLFWCFYIFMNGITDYKYVSHSFQIEKNFKISSAEQLRGNKSILKQHKLKYSDIENELVNDKKISLKGLHALCLLHKISITYISGHVYYILGFSNENSEYKNCVIIASNQNNCVESIKHTTSNVNIGVHVDTTHKEVQQLCEKKIHIKNYNKIMSAISSYTMPKLYEMATTLNIDQYTSVGKRKLKKQLYQEIYEKIC